MQTEIIAQLITVSPVVAVLVWVVVYFRGEKKALQERNDKLNDELRVSEKEAILVMKDLNSTLKDLVTEIKLNK